MASLAIEKSLIRNLLVVFSPDFVLGLEDEEIHRMVAESEETSAERSRCTEKLGVLKEGLRDLKQLDRHRSVAAASTISPISLLFDVQRCVFELTIETEAAISDDETPDTPEQSDPVSDGDSDSDPREVSVVAEMIHPNQYHSNSKHPRIRVNLPYAEQPEVAVPVHAQES